MRDIPQNHTHLWNDLPFEERDRLMPYMVEAQIMHLEQTRAKIVKGYNRTLSDLDDQINNLKSSEHLKPLAPNFENVYCSQCGNWFGPGDSGFSHCKDHSSVSDGGKS